MHATQGFGYPLPDLESPLFLSKLVLEDDGEDNDSGRKEADRNSPRVDGSHVTMSILQRLTAETYLLHDPGAGTPRRRWQSFLALHEAARSAAIARGLDGRAFRGEFRNFGSITQLSADLSGLRQGSVLVAQASVCALLVFSAPGTNQNHTG